MIIEESSGSVGTETVRLGGRLGLLVLDSLEVLCYDLKQETKIFLCLVFTGAQLRHNNIWILLDPSQTFTYNCDRMFKKISQTL